jgi:hypothetical protein
MSRRQLTGSLLVVALTAGAGAWAWSSTREAFQHPPHQALFPTCESCHQPQPDGMTKPDPSFCSACHNGQTVRTVSWTPTDRASNLDFDHATVLAAKEEALGGDFPCESCHQAPGGERMDVVRPAPETCYGCHAPGKEHQVEGACETCHSVQGPTTIVARRAPVTHTETFAENHKAAAAANTLECQNCHVQDQCSSCHTSSEAVTTPARVQPGGGVRHLPQPGGVLPGLPLVAGAEHPGPDRYRIPHRQAALRVRTRSGGAAGARELRDVSCPKRLPVVPFGNEWSWRQPPRQGIRSPKVAGQPESSSRLH